MAYCLVAFDTDRIQEYVFATGALREIRGGSALLDWLNRERMAQIAVEVAPTFNPEEHLIYANGGSGLFLIDEQYAQTFPLSVRCDRLTGRPPTADLSQEFRWNCLLAGR